MSTTICGFCESPLKNSLDNYGDMYSPVCMACHFRMSDAEAAQAIEPYYGMAPHTHDLTKTGSYIGSTVMDVLPEPIRVQETDMGEVREYDLGWAIFTTDPECENFGVYQPK